MQINPKLIIGLGNPSDKYEKTYHNAGFLFIDFLAGDRFKKEKSFIFTKEENFVLIKPLVFMNESGKAVSSAIKYFSSSSDKIKSEDIMVVHDDSDIALGDYKISFGRGSAGHRGIESIMKTLSTKDFWRLRIGIRKKPKEKAEKFVLKKITAGDLKILSEKFKEIKEKIINV